MKKQTQPQVKVDQLLDELMQDYSSPEQILGEQGLIKQLSKRLIERALQAELTHHLHGQPEPDSSQSQPVSNSRNGFSAKTVHTEQGSFKLEIPRDRLSEFEPIIVPKGQRRLAGLDEKIIALYARGSSTRDIQAQLEDLYGVELSPTLISQVTDAVSEEVRQWQTRPLDPLFPILLLDALYIKLRQNGQVKSRAVYLVLGISLSGQKEVLGLWIGPQENEGAKFWLKGLTDLKNRGLQDIFIACVDGLTGFPDAIETVYPQARVQLCIVHLVRNSLKDVGWKDRKEVAADLKRIYQSATVTEAEDALTAFAQKYDEIYPSISQIWLRHWERVIPLFDYPPDIRKVIYTTNAIESVNRSLRKVLKTKGAFPDEDSVFKLLYLALNNIAKKWTMPIRDWKAALARFAIEFPDRFPH
jgi:putative transposase